MVRRIFKHVYILISVLIVIVLGSLIALAMYVGSTKLPLRQYFSGAYTNAVWEWSDPEAQSPQQLAALSDFMYLHQLNAIYVNIGDRYTAAAAITDPGKQQAALDQIDRSLAQYVRVLGKHHVAVYAAAGDTSWSDQDKQHIPLSILQYVEQYNERNPSAKLAGVEFDIEAYNQPGFSSGSNTVKELVLNDWLDMVDRLATESSTYTARTAHKIDLGFAIPYWFDDENGNIPTLTRNYKTGPTLFFLLDRLNQAPSSNVVVMDYRNVAKGNDGTVFHGRTEIEYAQTKDPRVKVILGQEVNNVQPAKITYYGETMTDLSNQVAVFENEFKNQSTFKGIAINDLEGYQALKDE